MYENKPNSDDCTQTNDGALFSPRLANCYLLRPYLAPAFLSYFLSRNPLFDTTNIVHMTEYTQYPDVNRIYIQS